MKSRKLIYMEEDTAITADEYLSLLKYFDKQLLLGIELERGHDHSIDDESLARHFGVYGSHGLNFENDYHRHETDLTKRYRVAQSNKFNIALVKSDGSLRNGGSEIIFGGTNEGPEWVREKLEQIEKALDNLNIRQYDGYTSNHVTFITTQDKLIKPVLLKNIFNLCRAFSSALFWLGSADYENGHRGIMYCKPTLQRSPIGRDILELIRLGSKYNLCNIRKQNIVTFSGAKYLSGLCIEFRHIDGMRCPSALTANAFLLKALIYKALDLSRKGVVMVESVSDWERNKTTTKNFVEHQDFGKRDIQFLKKQAKELIHFLRPTLKLVAPKVIPALESLSDMPIYVRNKKWSVQEKQFSIKKKKLSKKECIVLEHILDMKTRTKTANEWRKKVANELKVTTRTIENIFTSLERRHALNIMFDKDEKSYMVVK